jgi:SAM-dependent methyltransferase
MARRRPWYETLFERDYYDYFYAGGPRGFLPEDRTDAQVDFIEDALELADGARVLDLCCGHGRHAVRLAQRGYRVTGVDLSAYHIRLAKAAARKAGVDADFVRGDMRHVPRVRGGFDAAINMFTAFGYFETEADDQRVLDGVARALKPGGRLLIDLLNRDYLMRVFRESDARETDEGGLVIERRAYDIHRGRMNVDMVYVRPDGSRVKRDHSVRVYTFPELAAMLSNAGMRVVRTWGNFDASDFTMQSPRMIVMAQTKGQGTRNRDPGR